MSDPVRTEQRAFRELEALVHHLADELATFRRRAQVAEAKLKDIESAEGGTSSIALAQRVAELERENASLQSRLTTVTDRAKQMLDRVRFLRQQAQGSER
jgi:predicted  nucleic acid-binding Zn-ribbon protein